MVASVNRQAVKVSSPLHARAFEVAKPKPDRPYAHSIAHVRNLHTYLVQPYDQNLQEIYARRTPRPKKPAGNEKVCSINSILISSPRCHQRPTRIKAHAGTAVDDTAIWCIIRGSRRILKPIDDRHVALDFLLVARRR